MSHLIVYPPRVTNVESPTYQASEGLDPSVNSFIAEKSEEEGIYSFYPSIYWTQLGITHVLYDRNAAEKTRKVSTLLERYRKQNI